jgi:hypothetical protein
MKRIAEMWIETFYQSLLRLLRTIYGVTEASHFRLNNQIRRFSNSDGKDLYKGKNSSQQDSTRNLEIIRPIETLPLANGDRFDHYGNKMSMIHEESHSREHYNQIHKRIYEKMLKTTNENIKDYQNNQAKEEYETRKNSLVSKLESQKIEDDVSQILDENHDDHDNHDIRTDKSDYDQSMIIRKGRFEFRTKPQTKMHHLKPPNSVEDNYRVDNFTSIYNFDPNSDNYDNYADYDQSP